MSLFTDKILLITGGTGSFGNAVLSRFLQTDIGEIRILSRDEKKQDENLGNVASSGAVLFAVSGHMGAGKAGAKGIDEYIKNKNK